MTLGIQYAMQVSEVADERSGLAEVKMCNADVYHTLLSTPFLLTVTYFSPLYGLTSSPRPLDLRTSTLRLSTLIPLGSQPLTLNETDTEVGIKDLVACAFLCWASDGVEGSG